MEENLNICQGESIDNVQNENYKANLQLLREIQDNAEPLQANFIKKGRWKSFGVRCRRASVGSALTSPQEKFEKGKPFPDIPEHSALSFIPLDSKRRHSSPCLIGAHHSVPYLNKQSAFLCAASLQEEEVPLCFKTSKDTFSSVKTHCSDLTTALKTIDEADRKSDDDKLSNEVVTSNSHCSSQRSLSLSSTDGLTVPVIGNLQARSKSWDQIPAINSSKRERRKSVFHVSAPQDLVLDAEVLARHGVHEDVACASNKSVAKREKKSANGFPNSCFVPRQQLHDSCFSEFCIPFHAPVSVGNILRLEKWDHFSIVFDSVSKVRINLVLHDFIFLCN